MGTKKSLPDRGSRLKLSYKTAADGDFLPALDRLSEDTDLPVKERYALARTRRNVAEALEDYDKLRVQLIKKFGVRERDLRKRHLKDAQEAGDEALAKVLQARLKNLPADNWIIDETDEAKTKKWRTELEQLQAIEFEIFLDHKIALPESCTISGKHLAALMEIIEEP